MHYEEEDSDAYDESSNGGGRIGLAGAVNLAAGPGSGKGKLRAPRGGKAHQTAFVSEYVRAGLNAPADFDSPDNLALDHQGNLYITEDPGGNTASGKLGDDIWVATPPGKGSPGAQTLRFATLTDCEAEPTGIYFDLSGRFLYLNIQHRGGDKIDLGLVVFEVK